MCFSLYVLEGWRQRVRIGSWKPLVVELLELFIRKL